MPGLIKRSKILIYLILPLLALGQPLDASEKCPDYIKDGISKAVREIKIDLLDSRLIEPTMSVICYKDTTIDGKKTKVTKFYFNSSSNFAITSDTDGVKAYTDQDIFLESGEVGAKIVSKCSKYLKESLEDALLIMEDECEFNNQPSTGKYPGI